MNASQYLKNVGKSLGYIAIDSFKQMNPNIAAVYDNAKEFTSDLYQTIDDFKAKAVGSDSASLKSKAQSTANEVWKNARDDFLSGKWYNKERKAAADDEMLKAMGFDFDLDFDLDDFGDTESPADKSDKVQIEQSQKEAEAIIGTVNGSVASAANTIASATTRSTEYLASIQNSNTAALYDLNVSGFNSVNAGLAAVNANVSALVTLAKPLTDHMQNSATFYAKSTEFQNKALDLLTKIANNTGVPEKKSGKRKNSFEDYIGEDGINLAALFSDAKESASKTIKDYKELLSMFGGVGGLTGDIKASPISALLTNLLIPAMIPGSTKKKMKNLNKYVGTLGFTELNKLSKGINDSPFGLILDLLGVDIPELKLKNKVNTGKYNQGRTFWTGRSEKALQYVIPYYLSKMTAVLDGSGKVEIFDYASGTFKTRADIQKDYDDKNKARASSASYSFYSRVKASGNKWVTREEINELSSQLIMFGGQDYYLLFSPNKKDRDDYLRDHKEVAKYLENHKSLKKLIDSGAMSSGSGTGVNKYDLGNYAEAIGRGQLSTSKAHSSYEESGEFDILFNNSTDLGKNKKTGGLLFGGVDKDGYTALDYLRGIYLNTSGGGQGTGSLTGNLEEEAVKKSGTKFTTTDRFKANTRVGGGFTVVDTFTAQKEAQKNLSNAGYSYSASATDILKELEDEYGSAWNKIADDNELKDYLVEKMKAKKEGHEEEFQEDSRLEAKIKSTRVTSKLTDAAKKFAKDTGLAANVSDFINKMGSLATKPTEIINKAIDLVHSTLHDIIFSKAGLFGWLFDKEHGKVTPVFKKMGGAFKRMLFGGPAEGVADVVPTNPAVGSALFKGVPTAYTGGYVRRTGLAAVSEGEMIIPAEFNPFYNGTVNKSQQRRAENRSIMRFFGSYANGTSGVGGNEPKQGGLVGTAANTIKQGFVDFGSMLFQLFSRTIGANGDEKSEQEERSKVANIIGEATNAIKEHSGDAILGGMIGGGISLLTGGVISPLLGASVGAATGLLLSSNKLKDFLFGNDQEQGKIFKESGPKIRRFIEDQLPSSLMGGAIGGIGGALMGHPVAGLFLGAGIGFVAKSKGMQSFLFGETDKEGNQTKKGLISKELQDKFKKALPGMSAGAITGLVASAFGGPFGLVGNMLIGAGVGGIVTSEKFKNWFFGDKDPETGKRKGGFVQELRDRLLDPTKDMFLNLGDKIRQDFRAAALGFFNGIKRITGTIANLSALQHLKELGVKGKDRINKALTDLGLPNLPTKLIPDLRGASEFIRSRNITGGYLSFKNGKALTAAERLNQFGEMTNLSSKKRDKIKGSFGYKMSEMLAGMDNAQLRGLSDDIVRLREAGGSESDIANIISNNASLNKYFGGQSLSQSQIRKMQDSLKIEMGKDANKTALGDIKDTAIEIKEIINDIWHNGIKIFSGPESGPIEGSEHAGTALAGSSSTGSSGGTIFRKVDRFGGDQTTGESSRSTVAGAIAEKKEKEAEDIRNKTLQIEEDQLNEQKKANEAMFGTDSDGERNDKETKKGGLLNKFFGPKSAIGKAASGILKVGTIIGAVFLGIASTGILDKLAAKLGIGFSDTDSGIGSLFKTVSYMFGGGREEGKDTIDVDSINSETSGGGTLSDRVWTMFGKQAAWVLPKLANQAREVCMNQLDDFAKIMAKLPILQTFFRQNKFANGVVKFFEKLLGKVDDVLLSAGGGTIKEILESVAIVITIAAVITDFTTGMQDARTTMKVLNPTIGERIFCGILRAVKNDIPFLGIVGSLIPDSFLFDIGMATIGKALDLEDLRNRRDEAAAELDEYNQEHGTNLKWDEYTKQKLNDKTFTERGWDVIKTGAQRTGAAVGNLISYAKESGSIAGGLKKYLTVAWDNANANVAGKIHGEHTNLGGEFWNEISPGIFGEFMNMNSRIVDAAFKGDFKGIWSENFEKLKEDKATDIITNILDIPLLTFKAGNSLVAGIVKVSNYFTDLGTKLGTGIGNGFGYLASEGFNGYDKFKETEGDQLDKLKNFMKVPEPDDSVMFKDLFKFAATAGRIGGLVTGVIGGAFRATRDMIKDSSAGKTFSSMMTNNNKIMDLMIKGDFLSMWRVQDTNNEGGFWNTISGFALGMNKIGGTVPALTIGLNKLFIEGIIEQGKNAIDMIGAATTDNLVVAKYAFTGDPINMWGVESSYTNDGFWGFLSKGVLTINKVLDTPFSLLTLGVKSVAGAIIDQKDNAVNTFSAVKNDIESMWKLSKDGNLIDLLLYKSTANEDGEHPIWGSLASVVNYGAKLLMSPVSLVATPAKYIGDVIGNFMSPITNDYNTFTTSIDNLKTTFNDDSKNFNDIFDMNPVFGSSVDGLFDFGFAFNKILFGTFKLFKGFFADLVGNFNWNNLWDNLITLGDYKRDESGSGSGIGGGSSGFVSQIDPRFAGKNLGGYNVGAMGCGPAAASMVLGNSMNSNINLARKYQTAGGTDLAYFAEAFSRNGRRPIYYNLGGGASGADMVQDIASGRPVVLMGRDPYNTSKRFSPFGPNNHYVVARGFRNGGIVIDDPESSAGGRIYDTSILRNVRAAVSAGASGLRRLTGIGGGSAQLGDKAQQCWAFFKEKGYSDAATAGILANIQAESSFRTTAVGDSGHAFGLCQWHDYASSSGRYGNMLATAKSMGKDVSDLTVQLTHIHNEIGQAGAGYSSLEDPYQAGYNFCVNFERPSNKDEKGKYRGQLAVEFYNAYSGKSYSYTADSSSNNLSALSTGIGATTQPKQETKASKFFNLVSTIGSAFTSAFTGSSFFGGNKNTASNVMNTTSGAITNNDVSVTSWPGKQPVQFMRDVLGKLQYNRQNRDPEKGGGDCSSTVAWALTKAGVPVTSDSRWQYVNQDGTNPNWQRVLWYNNGTPLGKGKDIPVQLQPNDVIFYSHGGSNYPDHVDHVEMYNGNGEIIGNGGGVGTRTRPVSTMQDQIIKIVRPKGPWDSASGSGLDLTDLRVTGRKENTVTRNGKVYNFSDYKRSKSSAGASGLDGGLNITKDTAILLRTMITLIESIVKNTNDISLIYRLLEANLTNSGVDKESAEAISKLVDDKNTDSSRIEDSLSSLKAAVDAILAS